MKLSIIIPVFNEEETVLTVITAVNKLSLSQWDKEIIIVDDGSTDATASIISGVIPPAGGQMSRPKDDQPFEPEAHGPLVQAENVKFFQHKKNLGKGAAVQTGIKRATGEYILIQDADLEYDPKQIPFLLAPIQERKAEIVFGTRLKRLPNFTRDEKTLRFFIHYLGNRMLSLLVSVLFGQWLTDIETGYKVFPKKVVKNLNLHSRGFEFEPEITVQLIKLGYKIYEVPIRTSPRGYEKGKKLRTVPDGIKALRMILQQL